MREREFENELRVVIPWRGFRCFTRENEHHEEGTMTALTVVIPWRGFRCFTHEEVRGQLQKKLEKWL